MGHRTRLPPLKALRAFTSAATHLNFSRAAEELCVTPAAVSYQVRLLETTLAASLFERLPRGLELTREGRSLQSVCEKAFGELAEIVETLQSGSQHLEVRIASVPHFSAHILFPARLAFMQLYPQLNLVIDHTFTTPDFSEDGYDFAVLFGKNDWPGFKADLLFHSPTAPACAPSLVEREGMAKLGDIARVPILLEHSCFHGLWVDWFVELGAEGWEKLNYVPCNDFHALLITAAQGYGFVMEPDFVIGDLLAKGHLVRPFAHAMSNYGYYLVYRAESLQKQSCRTFRDWLLREVSSLGVPRQVA
jgi:DNA-binding transcriptional LysR family regulator